MADKTTNYQLIKPHENEFYDIRIFNENADKIDTEIKKTNAQLETLGDTNFKIDQINTFLSKQSPKFSILNGETIQEGDIVGFVEDSMTKKFSSYPLEGGNACKLNSTQFVTFSGSGTVTATLYTIQPTDCTVAQTWRGIISTTLTGSLTARYVKDNTIIIMAVRGYPNTSGSVVVITGNGSTLTASLTVGMDSFMNSPQMVVMDDAHVLFVTHINYSSSSSNSLNLSYFTIDPVNGIVYDTVQSYNTPHSDTNLFTEKIDSTHVFINYSYGSGQLKSVVVPIPLPSSLPAGYLDGEIVRCFQIDTGKLLAYHYSNSAAKYLSIFTVTGTEISAGPAYTMQTGLPNDLAFAYGMSGSRIWAGDSVNSFIIPYAGTTLTPTEPGALAKPFMGTNGSPVFCVTATSLQLAHVMGPASGKYTVSVPVIGGIVVSIEENTAIIAVSDVRYFDNEGHGLYPGAAYYYHPGTKQFSTSRGEGYILFGKAISKNKIILLLGSDTN